VYIILLLTSACAQKEIVIKNEEITPLKQLEDRIGFTAVKGNLTVLNFSDNRSKKDSLGIAKTGMLNTETPIGLDISVSDYVKKRLISGLSKR